MTAADDPAGPGLGGPGLGGPGLGGPGLGGPGLGGTSAGVPPGKHARLTAWIEGRVQGVGFRWWARARALELGLAGWAENLEDGRVRVIAEGAAESCGQLLILLSGAETPGRVVRVTHRWDEPRGGMSGFSER